MTFRLEYVKFFKRLALDYIFLVIMLIFSYLPYCLATSHPVHDTMNILQTFYFFYNEYLINHHLPLWNPFVLFGTPTVFRIITDISPSLYLITVVGKIFNITDTLFLFKLSMFLEELFFVTGVYLLAKRVFRHTTAVLLVGTGSVFTVHWIIQLQLNFHSYYLLPFILLFIVRFSDSANVRELWLAWFAFLLSRIGTSTYLAPLTLMLVFVFCFILFATWTTSNAKTGSQVPFPGIAPRRVRVAYFAVPVIFVPGVLILLLHLLKTNADQLVQRILEVVSYSRLPYYLVPLQVFVFAVVAATILRRLSADSVFDLRSIFFRQSFLLLGTCCCMSAVYFDYVAHSFTEMQMYGVDRTSQAWNDLKTFLSYGGLLGPQKLWGYIYPEQVNSDITFYVGLIPLVFVVFAIGSLRRSRYLMAFLGTGLVLVCFAHGYLTLVAPLAYVLIPTMSYYRHLAWSMAATKIFMLVTAGFGIDAYLDSGRNLAGGAKESKLLLGVAATLLGIVSCCDLAVFHFSPPYVTTGIDHSPLDKVIRNVHYVALVTLGVFVAGLTATIRGRLSVHRLAATVVGLYLVNMSAYHLTMAFYTPGVEAGKPGVVLNIHGALEHKEERFREGFRARQYVFQNERVDQSRFHEINPYMGDILGYRGVKYSYLYSAFQVDPCRPVVYRADFIPLGVDRILRARLGLELDIPFDRLGMLVHWQDMLKGLGADGAMMRSIGCASPKLFVVFAPHVVTCLSEAADYIRNVHDIDRAPVILTRVSRESRCASAGVDRFGSSDLASGAEIEVLHFTANSLELTARVPRQAEDAWLIYLDSYHSGWKATVNGRRTEVAVANLAFKAVPLDSGKNHVQFVFKGYGERTPIFGIIIFVFGVIGSLALFGLSVLVSIFKNASGRQCI